MKRGGHRVERLLDVLHLDRVRVRVRARVSVRALGLGLG